MAGRLTLAIVKPDAFGAGKAGHVLAHIQAAGFRLLATRVLRLTNAEASTFYAVHSARPFFPSLTSFMTSGPCMPLLLEKADAVADFRRVIGATDPGEAEEGTIRRMYAESKERNAIHASDSDANATRESAFFFSDSEILRAR
ncbi:MAG: nucleoside-diphosphate kinase [Gemmatimonadaceae bacterium]